MNGQQGNLNKGPKIQQTPPKKKIALLPTEMM
jgi:hypothetical protein